MSASCRGAPASASATTSRWRCRTTRGPTTSLSAPNGRTAATWCASPTTARGSTTSMTRWCGTVRCGSTIRPARRAAAAWRSGRRTSAQTVSAAGYTKLAQRTQVTGFVSLGYWNNDEPLQPFTINSALPQLALPRGTPQAEARVFSTNLEFRLSSDDRLASQRPRAALRLQQRNAAHGDSGIHQLRHVRQGVVDRRARAVRALAARRSMPMPPGAGCTPLALTVGYTRNNSSHDFRIFEDTGEDVLRLTADAVGTQWLTFRAQYELAGRSGSGLNEVCSSQIGEQPALRHYDLANRTRNRFTGQVDVVPNDAVDVQRLGGLRQGRLRRQLSSACRSRRSASSRWRPIIPMPSGFGAGASYNYERYLGCSGRAPRVRPGEENDPLRDWTDRFDRARQLLLDLRDAATDRPQHRGAPLVRLQLRRGQLPLYHRAGRPAADAHSCPTCSTSCSSCTLT